MLRSRLLPIVVCLTGCATPMHEPVIAPDASPAMIPASLTHADCARLAVHHAPTAAAWEARLRAARVAVRQAATLPNPSVSISVENLGLDATSLQRTLSVTQAIAAIAAAPRATAAACHDLAATRADLVAERRRLVAAAWRAYDDLVAARRRATLTAEIVSLLTTASDAAAKRAAVGESTARERALAEAELAKAAGERTAAEGEARAQEIALCAALGVERPTSLRLSEGLSDLPTRTAEEIASAVHGRAEVIAASERYAARLERAHLSAAGFRFVPSPTVGIRGEGSATSAIVSWDLELPVFDSGHLAVRAAEAELMAAGAELRNTARTGAFQAAELFERDATARTMRDAHARPLVGMRRDLRTSAERLQEAGELDFDAVVTARRDEIDARTALLDAEEGAARARVALYEAVGLLDSEDP